jgi:tetratricopeptide (TPR) repeat protein
LRTAPPAPTGERPALLAAVDGIIAALFAILAVIHIQQLSARQEALISHLAANQQALRALQISRQLAELGSTQILGRPTQEVVTGLSRQVEASQQQVAAPLPANASLPQRLARAEHLHSLERFAEVERLLQDFDDDARATLRLALASEARHQYAQAADRYAHTIEQLGKLPNPDAQQLRLLRIAIERRVNNLRRIGKNRQAEAELLAGLERWPQVQDALLMQLGFHYQLAGRIGEAIEYFERAAVVNPRLQAQAEATLKQLELQAEGCILRPTRGVTR